MFPLDPTTSHRAIAMRAPRFDGVFFPGVASPRMYRPILCRARPAKRENCRFFPRPAAAGQTGWCPCQLCRPGQASGWLAATPPATADLSLT